MSLEQLMYRTHAIGVFIFIENLINSVCKRIHMVDKLLFSYKDLKGNGISRSITYLETVSKTKFPSDQTTKEDFEIAKIIRNSLVHQDGAIEEKDVVRIETYITKHPKLLSLDNLKNVVITYAYAKFLIDLSKKISVELERYSKSTFPW